MVCDNLNFASFRAMIDFLLLIPRHTYCSPFGYDAKKLKEIYLRERFGSSAC
jgi:hypothetical protein